MFPADFLDRYKDRVESLKADIKELEAELIGTGGDGTEMHSRYFAGNAPAAPAEVRVNRLADRAPDQWVLVVRDLYQDFGGNADLSSLTLRCPDGDYALFDHIYLARTPQDFERCPRQGQPIISGK